MLAALIGERHSSRDTRFIPALAAAMLEARKLAHVFADRAVVARRSRVCLEA